METSTKTSSGSAGPADVRVHYNYLPILMQCSVLLAGAMPISSGGNVKDGREDSYLKRYLRTLPEEKRNMIEKSLTKANNEQADISDPEENHVDVALQDPEPVKENNHHRIKADGEDSEGSGPSEPSSKKSFTCIVL